MPTDNAKGIENNFFFGEFVESLHKPLFEFHCTNAAGTFHPTVGVFVAISVVAYPDNPAAHIVGDNGLWCIAIGEHYQAIVIVLVGIVDGLQERGSAASDDCDVSHDLIKWMDVLVTYMDTQDKKNSFIKNYSDDKERPLGSLLRMVSDEIHIRAISCQPNGKDLREPDSTAS